MRTDYNVNKRILFKNYRILAARSHRKPKLRREHEKWKANNILHLRNEYVFFLFLAESNTKYDYWLDDSTCDDRNLWLNDDPLNVLRSVICWW